MGRFLLGILCAAALWYGYQAWFATPGVADSTPTAGADGEEEYGPVEGVLHIGGAEQPGQSPRAADPANDPVPADLVEAGSQAVSWRALTVVTGGARSRMAARLVGAADSTEDPAALLALLGRDNAFLHSEEGRGVARKILRQTADVPAPQAFQQVSQLFELCAQGNIAKSDEAARAMVEEVRAEHRALARRTVLDPTDVQGAKVYEVKRGDNLIGIASKMRKELGIRVESGTLQVLNRINNPTSIRPGQRLKVPMQPVSVTVWKGSFLVGVYVGERLARTYWCAHGREGHETPETTFVIDKKIEEPDWYPAGGQVVPYGHPDNPLGTLFVGCSHDFYTGFGVHGTWAPETIGTMASQGCIRLNNDQIVDFASLVPRGAEVRVLP